MLFLTYLPLLMSSTVASDLPNIKIGRLTKSEPGYWRTYLGSEYFPEPKVQIPFVGPSPFSEALEYFEAKAHDLIEARNALKRILKRISRSYRDVEHLQHVSSGEEDEEEEENFFSLGSVGAHCRRPCLKCTYEKARREFSYELDLFFGYVMDDISCIHDFFEETIERCIDVLGTSNDVREITLHRRLLPVAKGRLSMAAFLRFVYLQRYTYYDGSDNQGGVLN